ncbi:MAG: hypothetical protein V9G14_10225 [Cypionkella sp.]
MNRYALSLSAIALSGFLALPSTAQDLSPVKIAELSARLYDAGLAMKDPILIISAAKLRKGLNPVATDRSAEGATSETDAPLDWEDMLASAEDLAEGNEVVMGLAEDVRAESTKGVSSGPVYNIGQLRNGGLDAYPAVEFLGGEYAEVYVEAKSATDMNLSIYDSQGRLVCSDTDKSHIAYCGWRPAQSGSYVMKVENLGPNGAKYALMTN